MMRTHWMTLPALCMNSSLMAGSLLPLPLEKFAETQHCEPLKTYLSDSEMSDPLYALGYDSKEARNKTAVFLCGSPDDKLKIYLYIDPTVKNKGACPALVGELNRSMLGVTISHEPTDTQYFRSNGKDKLPFAKSTKEPIIRVGLGDESIEYRFLCHKGKWYSQFLH